MCSQLIRFCPTGGTQKNTTTHKNFSESNFKASKNVFCGDRVLMVHFLGAFWHLSRGQSGASLPKGGKSHRSKRRIPSHELKKNWDSSKQKRRWCSQMTDLLWRETLVHSDNRPSVKRTSNREWHGGVRSGCTGLKGGCSFHGPVSEGKVQIIVFQPNLLSHEEFSSQLPDPLWGSVSPEQQAWTAFRADSNVWGSPHLAL